MLSISKDSMQRCLVKKFTKYDVLEVQCYGLDDKVTTRHSHRREHYDSSFDRLASMADDNRG
jgi:hypothetical protein